MHDSAPFLSEAEARERSLSDDLRQLAEDARALAEAELAYQRSRAAFAGQEAKRIAMLGALAAVLVFFALMALTVGLVIALTPLLTAWGATAAVFAGLLVVAGLFALLAASRWKRMAATLADEKPE
jgi:hypothetical protein